MNPTTRRLLGAGLAALLILTTPALNPAAAQGTATAQGAAASQPRPAPSNDPALAPSRVVLGWAGDPATSQAVTWRTAAAVSTPQAQVALASAAPDLAKSARTVDGRSTLTDLGPLASQFYYLDYQGVRFISIDVNPFANEDYVESERARVQASVTAWLRGVLAKNPNRWTIVVQHMPFYDTAKERDFPKMRAALGPLYDEFHVDLVLQGHDHSYARSFKLNAGKRINDDEQGTVYVISVSGSKMYEITDRHEGLMAKVLQGSQLYQIVSVEDGRLTLESFGADGERVDAFHIAKAPATR